MRAPLLLVVLVAALTATCSRVSNASASAGTADARPRSIVPEQESAAHSGRPAAERASRASSTEEQQGLAFDGRALDAHGAPLASTTLTVQTWTERADHFTGDGRDVATDADGRFHVELRAPGTLPESGRFGLRIAAFPRGGGALLAAHVELAEPARSGLRALGDLRLVVDTPERTLATYSDDALEAALRAALAKGGRDGNTTRDWVLQLAEVVRRAPSHGARWERVVREIDARQMEERARALALQDADDLRADPTNEPSPPPAHDRHVLTTLRRLEGKPDPIVLEVQGAPVLRARFPTVPKVRAVLRNVDLSETVHVEFWCEHRDVAARLVTSSASMSATDCTAEETNVSVCRHPQWIDVDLPPGGVASVELSLPLLVPRVEPGELDLVLELDEGLRDRDAPSAFALASAPFRLERSAPPIRLARATYDALRADLRSIARDACVKLVREPWSPDTTFARDDEGPEDRLFRAGWSALPVLIDALDDPRVEPRHQEWALGLLFDLTGLHQPAGGFADRSLVGAACWEDAWPTTRATIAFSDRNGNGWAPAPECTVADLKSAWKALRAKLDVVIE